MPRLNDPKTPLLALLRSCSAEEREWLAAEAGTSVSYLYHLSGCQRTPTVTLASALAAATVALRKHTNGRTPKITVEQLASMCAVQE